MTTTILKFATGNDNKLREAQAILGVPLMKAEVGDLEEIQTIDVEELIRHKARGAYEIAGEPVMVEDTGLGFVAWNGLPGALIKWFLQSVNNEWILKMLEWYTDRRAEAICYVASFDGESYKIASGRVSGMITQECRGETNFGWDKIFSSGVIRKHSPKWPRRRKTLVPCGDWLSTTIRNYSNKYSIHRLFLFCIHPMLTDFRNQIDQIDDQLIELLAKRFEVVKQVGVYKKEHNLSPLQPGRWQEVLDKRTRKAEEFGLDPVFVVDVWNRIHEYALELEEKEKTCHPER